MRDHADLTVAFSAVVRPAAAEAAAAAVAVAEGVGAEEG